ncbi:MAG: hypothetical protein HA494_01655 [Thaumarchaeota archaeon]|nr:hypothetical protein [Nitrososphaerota archaeon]
MQIRAMGFIILMKFRSKPRSEALRRLIDLYEKPSADLRQRSKRFS